MVDRLNKKRLFKETFLITFLIMMVTLGLQYFPLNFEIAKPIKEEFSDFDVYDIIYTGRAKDNHVRDTDIIILQAAETRRQIAGQLELLQKYKPKVIGVDLTFIGHKDSLQVDSLLEYQLSMSNVVTGYRIDTNKITVIKPNFFDTVTSGKSGYINFVGDSIAVVRYYPPFRKIDGRLHYAFTSRIAEKYDQKAFSILEKNAQYLQVVNYRGNIESYTSFLIGQFDTAQFGEKIRDKIVLLGVLYKKDPLVIEDLHFTPVNDRINGKSFPDMYGVAIHANILSMIFSHAYIKSVARIWSYLIGVILTFLLVHYQLRSHYKGRHPAELWFFLLQFIIIIILVYIFLLVYEFLYHKVPLFPIVIPIVLCIEIIEVYKFLLTRLFKKTRYTSVFLDKKNRK
ncbi:MAG: CHASE2 domain-containing protein [Ginsengibacter sp.]